MSLRGDDRGVVIQVGAVILFGFLILAITMYQVEVVPDQNKEIEFKHNEEVQDQLLDVRSAIMTTAGGGGSRSVSVQLGTNYPSRTIFLNPSPPYGKLRTVGTENDSIAITIANARGTNVETAQYWDGGNRSFSTGALLYHPYYTRYDRAPTTIYENSVLANRFDGVILPQTNQTIVDGSEISLVALNGSVQESSVGAVSIDTKPLSVSQETITVRNHGGPLVLRIPTLFGNETWSALLSGERKNGNVTDYDVKQSATGPNTLVIEMAPGTYTLKLAKVGVGSNAKAPPESKHYVTTTGTNTSVQTGGVEKLTVEVRDRYNNPVEGELVTIDSPATPTSAKTDSDGQVTFTYDAPETPTTDRVTARIDGNASAEERVVFSVDVQAPSGGGGGGGGAYTVDWIDPSLDNDGTVLSNCTGTSCTWDVGKDGDDQLNLTAALNETVGGMTVEFGSDDTSVASVAPDETQTGSSGEATTDLVANANGTVAVFASSGGDSARIDIDVTNVTGGTNLPPTADFSFAPSTPDTGDSVSFDASGSSDPDGSIASYQWDFDDGSTTTGANPSHTYSSGGSYTVSLTVTDDNGGTDTATKTVTVNEPPTADFSYTPSAPDTGDTVSFDASASGDPDGSIASYQWDLGDGTTTAGETPSHTYTSTGSYTVTLTVTDDDGATDQTTKTVTVGPSDTAPPSIGDFTVTNPSGQDVRVTFDSNESLSTIDVAISGAESGTLTRGDFTESGSGPYTYTATYPGSTDGNYTATLNTAADAAGNDGASGQSDSVTVDTTGPSVVNATITNAPINESETGTPQTVTVTFSEAMNASVAPTVEITGLTSSPYTVDNSSNGWVGADTWKGTVTLIDDDEETTATISVADAEDVAGNRQSPNPDTGNTFAVDTLAPTITDFQASNPSGKDLTVTFNASEQLDAINVTVVRQGSGTTATILRLGDFTETCSGGTCEYSATTTLSRGGFHNVTLQRATDAVGNEGNQESTTLLIRGIWYNEDAVAVAEPNGNVKSGVEFSVTNELGSDVTVTDIYIGPENSTIARLDDPSLSVGEFHSEFYVEAGSDTYTTDFGNGKAIPTWFDLSEATNQNDEHLIENSETATYTLYEFIDTNDNSVDMVGQNVTVTFEYILNSTRTSKTFTITPAVPPTADFSYTPSNPAAGETIDFDASASTDPDGSIVSYQWDFGDDGTATGVTPSHSYSSSGTYPVTLTVTDDVGATTTVTNTVSVGLAANFTWSCTGASCSFDATPSSDPDGSITSYSWEFGDGETGTGVSTTHQYSPPGTYPVTLTVTDNDGNTDSTTKAISSGGGIQFGGTTTWLSSGTDVEQELTSNRNDDVTVVAVKVNNTPSSIRELDESGTSDYDYEVEFWESEFLGSTMVGYAGTPSGYPLPAIINLSSDGSPVVLGSGETQYLYLAQFLNKGGQAKNMKNEQLTISITYRVNGVTYTATKTVTVN